MSTTIQTGKEAYHALNKRQRSFVDNLLLDLTLSEAYAQAGYRSKTEHARSANASRLLANPRVMQAYRYRLQARSKRVEVDQDRTLLEIARLAFSDMRKIGQWDEQGKLTFTASDVLSNDAAAAIKSVEKKKDGSIKITLHGKEGPLRMLAAHLGITVEKSEVDVSGESKVLVLPDNNRQDRETESES